VIADSDELHRRYDLDDREHSRLVAMVAHPGMASNCMLYRANRLAPVVLNLPAVCAALGPALRTVLTDYWVASPTTDVHFLVEADRFRRFVLDALLADRLPADVADQCGLREALDREGLGLTLHLEASRRLVSTGPHSGVVETHA